MLLHRDQPLTLQLLFQQQCKSDFSTNYQKQPEEDHAAIYDCGPAQEDIFF
jgi:hypothetical protein